MLKRTALLYTTTLLVAGLSSCIFDPPQNGGGGGGGTTQNYEPVPLATRSAVLNNLEVSYNRRQINKYNEVLDENFTMFFSPGDISNGSTPEQWGRQDEHDANENLFDVNYQDPDGIQPRCLRIFVDVKWEDGVQWQQIEPASAPGEKWYTTTIFYEFQFDVDPDLHYVNRLGSKAQFTVRNNGTAEAPDWKLVEFRDLDAGP
jgi:hypothetical protein